MINVVTHNNFKNYRTNY